MARDSDSVATQDDRELLHRVFEALVARYQEDTYVFIAPETGSALYGDDKRFTLFAPSQAAMAGIGAAREHLLAAALIWRSSTGGTLMPMAYSTVLRGALLGASTAIWLLSPSKRNVRVGRAAEYAQDNFHYQVTAEEHALKRAIHSGISDPVVLASQREKIDWLKGMKAESLRIRQRELGQADLATNGGRHRPTTATAIVKTALEHAHDADAASVFHGLGLWELMSGDAHGNVWQKSARAEATGEYDRAIEDRDGELTMFDVNTPETLLALVGACTMLHHAAEELYRGRSTRPY